MTPGFLISRSVEKVKKFRSGLGLNIKHKGRRVKSLYLPLRCKWPTDNYDKSSYCVTSLNLIICSPRHISSPVRVPMCSADPGFVIIMYYVCTEAASCVWGGVLKVQLRQLDGQTWVHTLHSISPVSCLIWRLTNIPASQGQTIPSLSDAFAL